MLNNKINLYLDKFILIKKNLFLNNINIKYFDLFIKID